MIGRRWRGIFLKRRQASAELRELANTFLIDMSFWRSLLGVRQTVFSARTAVGGKPLRRGFGLHLAYSMQIDYGNR